MLHRTASTVAEAVLLAEWSAIFAYFAWRFLRFRKVVSTALAAMSLGWLVSGTLSAGSQFGDLVRAAAILAGVWVWFLVIRVERVGR